MTNRTYSPGSAQNQRGFGLLETSVALLTVAGSMLLLTSTFKTSNDTSVNSTKIAVLQSYIQTAKMVLATEAGCQKNFKDLTWSGTNNSFISITRIVDHQGNTVIEITNENKKFNFRNATLRELAFTRSTANSEYHQAAVDFSLSATATNGVYDGNSLRVPIQLIVDKITRKVVSCYTLNETPVVAEPGPLPSCGAGRYLNGISASGAPICLPLICNMPPPPPAVGATCKLTGAEATWSENCCSRCKKPIGTTTNFMCSDPSACGPGPSVGTDDRVAANTPVCNGCPGSIPPPPPPCQTIRRAASTCTNNAIAFRTAMNPTIAGSGLELCSEGNTSYYQVCTGTQDVKLPGGNTISIPGATAIQIVNANGYAQSDILIGKRNPTNAELTALGIPLPQAGSEAPGVNVVMREVTQGGVTVQQAVATESYTSVKLPAGYSSPTSPPQTAQGQVNRSPSGDVLGGAVSYKLPTGEEVVEIYEPVPGAGGVTCTRQTNTVNGVQTAQVSTYNGGPCP